MRRQAFGLFPFLMVCLVSTSDFAEVRDPQNLLGSVDGFFKPLSYEQAFRCGDTAEFAQMECGHEGCRKMPNQIVRVQECTTDQVTLLTQSSGTRYYSHQVLSRSHYLEVKGNPVRDFLSRYDFGAGGQTEGCQARMTAAAPVHFDSRGGESLSGLQVDFTLICRDASKGEVRTEESWILDHSLPWIAQPVVRTTHRPDLGSTTTWKIRQDSR